MKLIATAAAIEVLAGIILIVSPSLVARLVLNGDLNAPAEALGRIGGFGLLGLGLASWPGSAPLRGLLAYNVLAALFFIYLGVQGALVGVLLWPAAALHSVLAILLGRAFVRDLRA
jgi:hypothetical protein